MHEDIKRFEYQGMTDNNAQTREWFIHEAEKTLRDQGYVPSIDNEPQYTVEYVPETECFHFILSVFAVYVGEDSWEVSGVTHGKLIPRYTPRNKSNPS